MKTSPRTSFINGALIALGAAAILDNVILHWGLKWHRLAPYPWTGAAEALLFLAGGAMVAYGIWRE